MVGLFFAELAGTLLWKACFCSAKPERAAVEMGKKNFCLPVME